MILLADSGSTKTQWCLLTRSGQTSQFRTDGINPFFMSAEEIEKAVSSQLLPQIAGLLWVGPVEKVYFYGAGCTLEKCPVVAEALRSVFKKAEVEVASDMLGAARALLGHSKGVACILGTGSNSCYYDGEEMKQNVPSLGFILGDEGSGAALGKRLVADLLKNQLTSELKQRFLDTYQITQADIIENVYRKPFPNRYLAGLSKFAADNINQPLIRSLVYDHFDQFAVRILNQYPHVPIGFVGSIAYFYRDILLQVLTDHRFEIGTIFQSPIEGLISYHAYAAD